VPAIAAACQDPEIPRWTAVPSPYTEADARQWLESDEEESFAVVDKQSDELLGSIGSAAPTRESPRLVTGLRRRRGGVGWQRVHSCS